MSDYDPQLDGFHGIFSKLSKLDIFENASSDLYSEEFADYYNDLADRYASDVAIYLKHLPQPRGRVLDLACGAGRISIPLAQAGATVDGIDLSNAMLKTAFERLACEDSDIRERLAFHQGDMCTFELPNRYDLILVAATSISLLLTAEQRGQLFAQVKQHLKPCGIFLFDILDFSGDKWRGFDHHTDVWHRETDEGQEFAIIGQRVYPDTRQFIYNVYRECISWNGETRRHIGLSVKAWLDKEVLSAEIEAAGLAIVEVASSGPQQYFTVKHRQQD